MKLFKQTLIQIGIFLLFFVTLELCSYIVLRNMGVNPLDTVQKYPYGRRISGYYATENLPNHTYNAFDGLDHFKPDKMVSDSFSFFSDKPLHVDRTTDEIRIFLTGGSAAFGSIESQEITHDKSYPSGCYTYNSSIAGIMKAELNKKFPDKHFEVINAAVVAHRFNQNYLMYYAAIHQFHPDIIINMDGYNEGYTLRSGMPFSDPTIKDEMEGLIDLEARSRYATFPFTVFLINYTLNRNTRRLLSKQTKQTKQKQQSEILDEYFKIIVEVAKVPPAKWDTVHHILYKYMVEVGGMKKNKKEDSRNVKEAGLQLLTTLGTVLDSAQIDVFKSTINQTSYSTYKIFEPLLIEKSQTLFWLINSYEAQLKGDNIYSIFCLQPMLNRRLYQKTLSPLELQLRTNIEGNSSVSNVYRYFFDDYFTSHADSIVKHYGGAYIDMNKEITGLKSTDEFYVDYCHLTPFGTKFVAEKFAKLVETHLQQANN